MTKLFRLVMVMAMAVVLGAALFSSARSGREAESAEPRLQIVTFSPLVLESILDLVAELSPLGNSVYDPNGMTSTDACIIVVAIRTATGDDLGVDALDPDENGIPCEGEGTLAPEEITAEDYALLDPLDAEQVSENGEDYTDGLFVLVLNRDPDNKPMEFEASDGSFVTIQSDVSLSHGSHFTCDSAFHDLDCVSLADGAGFRDGFVGVAFTGPLDSRGDITITAKVQGDSDRDAATVTLKGVGDPVELSPLLNLDPKLEVGGTQVCRPGGNEFNFANLLQITTLAGLPDAGLVAVQVKDSDGTGLTGIPVEWESADEDVVIPGFSTQFSLFNSGLLLGPNLVCSGSETGAGSVEVTVRSAAGSNPDVPGSVNSVPHVDSVTLSWTVIGKPAQIVAYADPPTIDCNGVNTTTVNVQVLDSQSNNGVGGNEVRFDVQVLGTANPIVGKTNGEGLATSVVTPLVQEGATGVPVLVSVRGLTGTVLVNCQVGAGAGVPGTGAPPTTGGGAGQPSGSITGPDTGNGGVAGRGSLPVWPAVALFIAAMGLVGARFGLRRSA